MARRRFFGRFSYPRGRFKFALMKSRNIFGKRRRLRRKLFSRRNHKKEIHYATLSLDSAAGVPLNSYEWNYFTPSAIAPGGERNNRIGNRIKFLSVYPVIEIYCLDNADPAAFTFATCRLVIFSLKEGIDITFKTSGSDFTPLTDQLDAINLSKLAHFDFNLFNIHFDRSFAFSNQRGVNNVTTVDPGVMAMASGHPAYRYIKKYIKFPRVVTFTDGLNLVRSSQDHLYFAIFNTTPTAGNAPNIAWRIRSRTTWVDI